MDHVAVIAKRDAAAKWCNHASAHANTYEGKPWKYVLIPHDVVLENMTLERLAAQFTVG
jgi:type III restriction enzyme